MVNDLRVLIIADDPLVRAGLAALLSDQAECTIVGQVASDSNLPDSVTAFRPDVLLWDLGWNPTPMMERLADLPEGGPPLVVLLPDETFATEAWTAGAAGLLLRSADSASLVAALRAATSGIVAMDPQLAAAMVSARGTLPPSAAGTLTPRELEVLRLVAEGLPNKSIALHLGVSEHTVKFHVNAILGKLGAQSRTEAVMQATRLGLIAL